MPIVPALGRWRPEDQEFKVMLLYLCSRFILAQKKKRKKGNLFETTSSTHTKNSHISKNAPFYSFNVKRFAKITLFGLQVRFSAEEQVAWFWESKITER